MKIATEGYVKINLLRLAGVIGVPSGKTRIRANGEIEAEFVVISKGCAQSRVWATHKEISYPQVGDI